VRSTSISQRSAAGAQTTLTPRSRPRITARATPSASIASGALGSPRVMRL
jgi:hypothetical protein